MRSFILSQCTVHCELMRCCFYLFTCQSSDNASVCCIVMLGDLQGTNGSQLWDTALAVLALLEVLVYDRNMTKMQFITPLSGIMTH